MVVFDDLTRKLRMLNPMANIGVSRKTNAIIWSEVPAAELVLPPTWKATGEKLVSGSATIEVREYGQ